MAALGFRQAAKELGVSKRTLENWRNEYPQQYSDFRAARNDDYRKAFAAKLEDLAENYTEVEQAAIAQAAKLIKGADAKEAAALIKAMGSSRGLAAVNARQARGEPDKSFDLNINFPQLEQAAERILEQAPPAPAIDVSSTELSDDG